MAAIKPSHNQYKDLRYKLHNTSGHSFQHLIYELLHPLIPSLKYAADLKELDKYGIDLVSFDNDGNYDLIIQCKGFEVAGFGDNQYKQ